MIKERKLLYSKFEEDRKREKKVLIEAQKAEMKKRVEDLTKHVKTDRIKELIDAKIAKCKYNLKLKDYIMENAKDRKHFRKKF